MEVGADMRGDGVLQEETQTIERENDRKEVNESVLRVKKGAGK